MHTKNEEIALKWLEAFNKQDIEKLITLYSDDAVHYSPKLKILQPETMGFIKGKSHLKQWWVDAFERLPQLHYQLIILTANDKAVCIEYVRKVPGEEDMLVAEILDIEELIIASRVYHG